MERGLQLLLELQEECKEPVFLVLKGVLMELIVERELPFDLLRMATMCVSMI